jgi:proline dehydrogenase
MRSMILAASRNATVEHLVGTAPLTRNVVHRFVPGPTEDDAVAATRRLVADGLLVSLDHLGEDTTDPEHAAAAAKAYLSVLDRLAGEGLTAGGRGQPQAVGGRPGPARRRERIALEHAHLVCAAAERAGTTVTLDMEDHTTTDSTLRILAEIRKDFPATGAVLQSYLRRTEADCRDLATAGSRVRLCKGAYEEPASVAYKDRAEVDKSYVRCLAILMAGAGRPMIATHDPRMIAIAQDRAAANDRAIDSYEFQMLYGIRPNEQRRLVELGHPVRVYTPYGVGLVRLLHAPAGRATGQRGVLPARAGDPVVSRLAVLGAGKIGEALLSGLLRAGRPVEEITVVVRRAERAKELEERYGVRAVPAAEAAGADVLLVTVKPQDIEGLVGELAPHVQRSSLVVSLAAGIPTAYYAHRLRRACRWCGSCRTPRCWWTRR